MFFPMFHPIAPFPGTGNKHLPLLTLEAYTYWVPKGQLDRGVCINPKCPMTNPYYVPRYFARHSAEQTRGRAVV